MRILLAKLYQENIDNGALQKSQEICWDLTLSAALENEVTTWISELLHTFPLVLNTPTAGIKADSAGDAGLKPGSCPVVRQGTPICRERVTQNFDLLKTEEIMKNWFFQNLSRTNFSDS